jgi:hypothetical protein
MGELSALRGKQEADTWYSVQVRSDIWQIREPITGQLVVFGMLRREARELSVLQGWQCSMTIGSVRLEFSNTAMSILP